MKDMEASKATDECGGKSPSRKKKREEDEAHGGREANEDEDFTAFALEAPRWNVMLQDALETYFTKGVPVPSAASTLKESQEITRNSFVHRQFIRDRDGVLYKIEATAVLPSSPSSSASSSPSSSASSSPSSSASSSFSSLSSSSASSSMVCRVCREAAVSESTASVNSSSPSQPAPASDEATGDPVKKRCLAGGWRDRTSEYVEPSQVLLYVSYRHFQHVWSAGASEVVLHFLTGKELAECRVMALDRAACRYDLLIEIASLPQAPSLRSLLDAIVRTAVPQAPYSVDGG
ncbi:hypothetical protein TGMAS_273280A [Toxoplasma gondii MAS]|uniref:Uncharacterized protein n=1 Tax=Toxoplasma gondii MAS TaxID=943118 RepID=A0A086QWT4_TOXGO|nr:hypothetical protein TGMAS_273280A [Toxoplasma gondii MAS]